MKEENIQGIERILAEKKDLIRLFLIATLLAFAVGGLASLFISLSVLPKWSIFSICSMLIFLSFVLLTKDLTASLSFKEVANAVVFFDPNTNKVLPIKDYKFAEQLFKTLKAVKAENKAIYGEWVREPLVPQRPSSKVKDKPDDSLAKDKPSWLSIVKVMGSHDAPRPKSIHLLEEAAQFVLIEELSLHLSSYFNNTENDSFIKEYCRDDIPAFLLNNRVMNLLSTPIEQREIFLTAFPDDKKRPEGEICSLWGSDGAIFSRFDLVLPRGSAIKHSDDNGIKIETKRLLLELKVKYTDSSDVISRSFAKNYIKKEYEDVCPLKMKVTLKGQIKPLALLTSSGWHYYQWLDSFRQRLHSAFDFNTFQNDIHWDVIEPLLFSMIRTKKHAASKLSEPQKSE